MDKNAIYKICKSSYSLYVEDYKQMLDDYDSENSISTIVRDDLSDKGFTKEEITHIINKEFSDYNIMCKFIAYAISIYHPYENTEQLSQYIQEFVGITLEQDDLDNIYKFYDTLL